MATISFEKDQFLRTVEKLSRSQQLVFAASCCESLMPLYEAFQAMEGLWGDLAILRETLDYIWDKAGSPQPIAFDSIESKMRECELAIPDADDFSGIYVAGAQYAAASVLHCLRLLEAPDATAVYRVSKACFEATRDFLSTTNDPRIGVHSIDKNLEAWVETTPIFKSEVKRQIDDLQSLESKISLEPAFLRDFRNQSMRGGIAPFERGFLKQDRIESTF